MGTKPAKHTEATDPFDIEALQLSPEAVAELVAIQKGSGALPVKPKRVARQPTERYVQMTRAGAKGFEVLGCPMALVWFEILYLVWKDGKTTIVLPNKKLAAMGASKWAKYRTIDRLEKAGWISVTRSSRKSVRVTLLKPECVRFRPK
jgi:hypothetical protein